MAALTAVASAAPQMVSAFEIETDNPDLRMRWDNKISYTAAFRTGDASDTLVNTPPKTVNQDDGDRNFGKGLISNRFDLFSEFDVSYGNFGARISGAAWYDDVYNNSNDNDSPATNNNASVASDEFTSETRDLHGRDAELLDAFVYGRGDVLGKRSSFRLGRHAVLYGESLFFGANGIAGTQGSVDVVKLQSNPNAQFRETIRPTNQLSASMQLSEDVSLGAYYQFEWEKLRVPATGSYFSTTDTGFGGGSEKLYLGPFGQYLEHGNDVEASDSGQGGIQLRHISGDWEFGYYATRFHSKTGMLYQDFSGADIMPSTVPVYQENIGEFYWVFPEDITAYGASFSTVFGNYNVAGELSARRNQPLVSDGVNIIGTNADNNDDPAYAVGDTLHAQVSVFASLARTFISDEANLLGEIAYHKVDKITKNESAFNPLATNSATALRLLYIPTYRQVFAGTDISVPVGLSYSPSGRSPILSSGFGTYHGGDISIGVKAQYLSRYNFGINFTHYYGDEDTFLDGSIPPHITQNQSLGDRDFISLSFNTTF
jgi:hypothetical protein